MDVLKRTWADLDGVRLTYPFVEDTGDCAVGLHIFSFVFFE